MATLFGMRALRVSAWPAKKTAIAEIFAKSSQPTGAAAHSAGSAPPRFSLRRLLSSPRLPVELSCAQSLIPLHSATASALYTSLLSLHSNSWGCLSEGFATPL